MAEPARSHGSPLRAETLIIAVVVALALAALAYVMSQRQQALRASAVGLDGLQMWLAEGGASAQVFSGGWILDPVLVDLLVVPLHDTRPGEALVAARSKADLLFQQDENDVDWQVLFDKLGRVPSLVVLPKWRSGMRLTGVAHPALMVDPLRVEAILRRLTDVPDLRLVRSRQVFARLPFAGPGGAAAEVELYAAQLFDGRGCEAVIGAGAETLLARCPLRGSGGKVLILSDPDLLNNHGLRLGDNAEVVRAVLAPYLGEGRIVIDYSLDDWFAETDAPVQHERSWADLLRFFEPPFLALWLGALALLALALWRSFRRVGPVADSAARGLGKMQAIAARARLMRLTGQDGAMLGDYAAARIAATAARLVGPGHARQIGEETAFLRYVGRRSSDLAGRLSAALDRLHALPRRVPAAVAIRHVEDFEAILELIANDT